MPYMHKESFDISIAVPYAIGNEDTGVYDPRPDFFQVDELIAVQIQILNRKGYKTACCCAGHPFDAAILAPVMSETGAEKWVVNGYMEPECESYITFAEDYAFELDTLPHGFRSHKTGAGVVRIVREHPKNGDYWETIRSIMDAMEQLYLWASALPDRSK